MLSEKCEIQEKEKTNENNPVVRNFRAAKSVLKGTVDKNDDNFFKECNNNKISSDLNFKKYIEKVKKTVTNFITKNGVVTVLVFPKIVLKNSDDCLKEYNNSKNSYKNENLRNRFEVFDRKNLTKFDEYSKNILRTVMLLVLYYLKQKKEMKKNSLKSIVIIPIIVIKLLKLKI